MVNRDSRLVFSCLFFRPMSESNKIKRAISNVAAYITRNMIANMV